MILEHARPPSRVLIVDDERKNRQVLEIVLQAEGYSVQIAESGEQALELVRSHPPDLILLDVMMPGTSGYQVVAAIKSNPLSKNIPVIMVTALDDREAKMLALRSGAEDFLSKPVDRAELCLRVRNLLRLKAYSDYHDSYSQVLQDQLNLGRADLVASERLYRSTFDAAPVGIVHVSLTGQWLRVNQRLCELLGYSRSDLLSAALVPLLQSEVLVGEAESLSEMLAGRLDHCELEGKRYLKQDGTFMWSQVKISLHRDADQKPRHFIWVIEDVSERRMLEARLRQASKMEGIGQLAAGVAHDFNNLLTVILGCSDLISSDASVAEQHTRELTEITKAAGRATSLTRQLLAFSRQQILQPTPLDLNDLVRDMTGMLTRLLGKEVEVAMKLAPNLSLALADRSQVEQIVMNLVVNARDSMPGGGRVTIETAEAELENSCFHNEEIKPGKYLMLAVSDQGSGMTAETQSRLFEPFFTTKGIGKGTGLGLSTTYGIVKQSEGYIWVYTELGRGTTFKVFLPRSSQSLETQSPPPILTTPWETVLLVEDEPGLRQLLKLLLTRSGYQVLEAWDAQRAQQIFTEHKNPIALVVTDVILPDCDGPELVGRLLLSAPEMRVLYMSGYPEQIAAEVTGLAAGQPFLQKPFTSLEFKHQVRAALDRKVI